MGELEWCGGWGVKVGCGRVGGMGMGCEGGGVVGWGDGV